MGGCCLLDSKRNESRGDKGACMDFGKGMALKTQVDSKDVSRKAWVGRGRRLKDKEEGCGRKRGEMVRGYQDHISEISTHSYSVHQARPALPEGLITGLVI